MRRSASRSRDVPSAREKRASSARASRLAAPLPSIRVEASPGERPSPPREDEASPAFLRPAPAAARGSGFPASRARRRAAATARPAARARRRPRCRRAGPGVLPKERRGQPVEAPEHIRAVDADLHRVAVGADREVEKRPHGLRRPDRVRDASASTGAVVSGTSRRAARIGGDDAQRFRGGIERHEPAHVDAFRRPVQKVETLPVRRRRRREGAAGHARPGLRFGAAVADRPRRRREFRTRAPGTRTRIAAVGAPGRRRERRAAQRKLAESPPSTGRTTSRQRPSRCSSAATRRPSGETRGSPQMGQASADPVSDRDLAGLPGREIDARERGDAEPVAHGDGEVVLRAPGSASARSSPARHPRDPSRRRGPRGRDRGGGSPSASGARFEKSTRPAVGHPARVGRREAVVARKLPARRRLGSGRRDPRPRGSSPGELGSRRARSFEPSGETWSDDVPPSSRSTSSPAIEAFGLEALLLVDRPTGRLRDETVVEILGRAAEALPRTRPRTLPRSGRHAPPELPKTLLAGSRGQPLEVRRAHEIRHRRAEPARSAVELRVRTAACPRSRAAAAPSRAGSRPAGPSPSARLRRASRIPRRASAASRERSDRTAPAEAARGRTPIRCPAARGARRGRPRASRGSRSNPENRPATRPRRAARSRARSPAGRETARPSRSRRRPGPRRRPRSAAPGSQPDEVRHALADRLEQPRGVARPGLEGRRIVNAEVRGLDRPPVGRRPLGPRRERRRRGASAMNAARRTRDRLSSGADRLARTPGPEGHRR